MASQLYYDRVKETAQDVGSATFTLRGAPLGFRAFSAAFGDGDLTSYAAVHLTSGQWEVGDGTYDGGTLTRDTVRASSTGSLVAFDAGPVRITCVRPAATVPVFAQVSKAITYADLTAAALTQTIAFDDALPLGAIVIGAGFSVGAVFDNAGDTASVSLDIGHAGDADAFCVGLSLDATGAVGAPTGVALGALVGAVTPRLTVSGSVNLNTIAKGSGTAYVVALVAF